MGSPIFVRPALHSDQTALENLLESAQAMHKHLDWRSPLEWLGSPYFLLAEAHGRLQGLLICSAEGGQLFWLRVLGIRDMSELESVWQALFSQMLNDVQSSNPGTPILCLAYYDWLKQLLEEQEWQVIQRVVQLRWVDRHISLLSENTPPALRIRPMILTDLSEVQAIDQACFPSIWSQSLDVTRRAFLQSSHSSVAELENDIVGFQISSSHKSIAHLARLAVRPANQGIHIGQALLQSMLKHFRRPWIREITVNTQQDNQFSLKLYQKMGFQLTGESYPIYSTGLYDLQGRESL